MATGDVHTIRIGTNTFSYIEGTEDQQFMVPVGNFGTDYATPYDIRSLIPIVSVADIHDPSTELADYGPCFQSGTLLICVELEIGVAAHFSLYAYDAKLSADDIPWVVEFTPSAYWKLIISNWGSTGSTLDKATLGSLYIGDMDSSFEVDFTGAAATNVLGWNGTKWVAQGIAAPGAHHEAHEDEGADEIDLTDLSGMVVDGLDDVTITGVANNELLAYDAGTSKWINQTAAEAGITVGTLAGLSDVVVGGMADNEVLAYDTGSSKWINQTAAEAGLVSGAHTHDASDIDAGQLGNARLPDAISVVTVIGSTSVLGGYVNATSEYRLANVPAIDSRASSVAHPGYAAGDPPTQNEFNALVTTVTNILYRLEGIKLFNAP